MSCSLVSGVTFDYSSSKTKLDRLSVLRTALSYITRAA